MRITATHLRQLIREELLRISEQDRDGDGDEDFDDVRVARFTASGMSREKALAKVRRKPLGRKGRADEDDLEPMQEAVKNTHGYTVRSASSIVWSSDKAQISADQNPFVGGTPAFESWYNDGEPVITFTVTQDAGLPTEERRRMFNDVLFKEGDLVIIPELWSEYPTLGEILLIKNVPASGVDGASETDTIPLVNIRFQTPGGPPRQLRDVGLAFLRRVAGGRSDPDEALDKANEYMRKRGAAPISTSPDAPTGNRKIIRRRAGEETPQPAALRRSSAPMTPEERAMLLGRNWE